MRRTTCSASASIWRAYVKLPDGSTRSGRLGPDGTAYVRAIPEGSCEVTFPDYDGDFWKPAYGR